MMPFRLSASARLLARRWRGAIPRQWFSTEDKTLIESPAFLSDKQFTGQLRRERARANRADSGFLLVTFELTNTSCSRQTCQEMLEVLAHAVCARARASDVVGEFEGRIGLLLPDAPMAAVKKLVEGIECSFCECARRCFSNGGALPDIVYGVYEYPTDRRTRERRSRGTHSKKEQDRVGGATKERGISPDGRDPKGTTKMAEIAIKPRIEIFQRPLPVWKRTMDLVSSTLGLIILAPVFVVVGLYIKVVSPGPVFFGQIRVGRSGREFVMWKFRTMRSGADQAPHQEHITKLIRGTCSNQGRTRLRAMHKIADDPRLDRWSRFLRGSCIDELPQLFNVLRGEMSLVGPRPPIPYEVDEYLRWHRGRFDVVPGMTGLWQVSGRNELTFEEMIRLDIKYAQKRSLLLDLKIIVKTPSAVLSPLRNE